MVGIGSRRGGRRRKRNGLERLGAGHRNGVGRPRGNCSRELLERASLRSAACRRMQRHRRTKHPHQRFAETPRQAETPCDSRTSWPSNRDAELPSGRDDTPAPRTEARTEQCTVEFRAVNRLGGIRSEGEIPRRSGLAPDRRRPRSASPTRPGDPASPPHEPGQGRSSWSLKKVAKGTPKDPHGSPRIPQGPPGLSAISPEQAEGLPWSRVDPEGQVPPPHPRRSGRLGHRPPAASEGANEEGRRRGRTRGQKPANWPRLPRPSPRDRR